MESVILEVSNLQIASNQHQDTFSKGSNLSLLPSSAQLNLLQSPVMDQYSAAIMRPNLPPNWQQMPSHAEMQIMQVLPTSEEFQPVAIQFHEKMALDTYHITRIDRVQNPNLLSRYVAKKESMEQTGISNELKLFHGTTRDCLVPIALKNFSMNCIGRHHSCGGLVYGQGIYFATGANTAHMYTDIRTNTNMVPSAYSAGTCVTFPYGPFYPTQVLSQEFQRVAPPPPVHFPGPRTFTGNRVSPYGGNSFAASSTGVQSHGPASFDHNPNIQCSMFICDVLTGVSVESSGNPTAPPLIHPKDPTSKRHDSCYRPTRIRGKHAHAYIIFDPDQCYPSYIITYTFKVI